MPRGRRVGVLIVVAWCAVLGLAGAPAARADAIPPGKKSVDYCFEVANLDAYPDYVFLAYFGQPGGGYTVIAPGQCIHFYKFSHPALYAMARADFDPAAIPGDRVAERAYFTGATGLIPSSVTIQPVSLVDQDDPVSAVVDVLRITALDGRALAVEKAAVRYTFVDGTTEELPYRTQDARPAPTGHVALPGAGATPGARAFWWAWYVALPAAALLGLGAIFALRRRRHA
jgi:hypothetical protein